MDNYIEMLLQEAQRLFKLLQDNGQVKYIGYYICKTKEFHVISFEGAEQDLTIELAGAKIASINKSGVVSVNESISKKSIATALNEVIFLMEVEINNSKEELEQKIKESKTPKKEKKSFFAKLLKKDKS
jgi:hypothetical protein